MQAVVRFARGMSPDLLPSRSDFLVQSQKILKSFGHPWLGQKGYTLFLDVIEEAVNEGGSIRSVAVDTIPFEGFSLASVLKLVEGALQLAK